MEKWRDVSGGGGLEVRRRRGGVAVGIKGGDVKAEDKEQVK